MSVAVFRFVLLMLSVYGCCSVTTPSSVSNVEVECRSWQEIKAFLQQKLNHGNCVVNSDCTGLGCSCVYKDHNVNVDVKVNGCENPISLEIILNIPFLGINNTKHKFNDGQRYQLPPASILRPNIYAEVSLKRHEQNITASVVFKRASVNSEWALIKNQNISIPPCKNEKTVKTKSTQITPEEVVTNVPLLTQKTLLAALTLKTCSVNNNCNASEMCLEGKCVCETGTIQEGDKCIPIHESNKNTQRPCDKSKLHQCLETEMCTEVNQTSILGICICLENYQLDVNKHCIADVLIPEEKSYHSVTVTLAIAIPVLVLMACAGLAFIVYKFKLVHRFQVYQRGVRSYEVVEIGNNDEDDDEPLVT